MIKRLLLSRCQATIERNTHTRDLPACSLVPQPTTLPCARMTPCSPLNVNRLFGWTYRFHLQGRLLYLARNQRATCGLLLLWFLTQLNFLPWRWRRYVPPRPRLTLNGLHGVISQNVALFIFILLFYLLIWTFGLKFCRLTGLPVRLPNPKIKHREIKPFLDTNLIQFHPPPPPDTHNLSPLNPSYRVIPSSSVQLDIW
jgi:hypothetical protein